MDVSTQSGAKARGEIEQIMRRATAARQNVPPQSSAAHHEPTTRPPANHAAAEPVAQAASLRARALERLIDDDLARQGRRTGFSASTLGADQLPHALSGALAAFERATNTRVVVFQNRTPDIADFNGVTRRDGVLYVAEDAQHPLVGVAAHEWVHNLKRTHPHLYEQLAAEVERQGRAADYARHLGYAPHEATEELTAAAVGDAMADVGFLQRLAADNLPLFSKVARAFMQYLNGLIAKMRDQGTNPYFEDVAAFRETLIGVIRQYEGQRSGTQSGAYPVSQPAKTGVSPSMQALSQPVSQPISQPSSAAQEAAARGAQKSISGEVGDEEVAPAADTPPPEAGESEDAPAPDPAQSLPWSRIDHALLKQVGGKPFKTYGGELRFYFNNLAELIGLEYGRYKTGNVKWAELNGKHYPNYKAREILHDLDRAKVYIDPEKQIIEVRNLHKSWIPDIKTRLVQRIQQALDERSAAVAAEDAPSDDAPAYARRQSGDADLQAIAELDQVMRRVRGSSQAQAVRGEIVGRALENTQSGMVATVSGTSWAKMMSRAAVERSMSSQAHMQALGNLDHLFRVARYVERRAGKKAQDAIDIAAIHHFEAPMPFDGQILRVRIMGKEFFDAQKGQRIYLVSAVEMDDAGRVDGAGPDVSGSFQSSREAAPAPKPSIEGDFNPAPLDDAPAYSRRKSSPVDDWDEGQKSFLDATQDEENPGLRPNIQKMQAAAELHHRMAQEYDAAAASDAPRKAPHAVTKGDLARAGALARDVGGAAARGAWDAAAGIAAYTSEPMNQQTDEWLELGMLSQERSQRFQKLPKNQRKGELFKQIATTKKSA